MRPPADPGPADGVGQGEAPANAAALRGRRRHDKVAIGVLACLPVIIFALPALAGHPVMPGDDHTQNYPLRMLAGAQLRQGHLPLFDPYIWSGAPLLGGWNAAAAYPLTFLFAVLPGVAAWTVTMIVTWWAAGLGTFAFLRASRLSPVASLLGALSFAFAGAMTAQIPHVGLVAGMSWVPVALLASLRLSQRRGVRARLGWTALLAGAVGMVILAGEPRAIDDAMIILVCYAGWRAWRLGRWTESSAYLGVVLAGVALGAALGAVQWIPGIEAIYTSQRAATSVALFDSGSLARKRLLLSLVPDLLGGSGSFGQPAFLGTYSLNEVTGYAGLMPLVAACALLGQLRWPRLRLRRPRAGRRVLPSPGPEAVGSRRLPEWVIWHLVALAGVLLALGGNTPLGHALVRLPFFGDQRLQSRNLVIADFGLAVLLAYWADRWLGEPRARARRGARAGRVLGSVPGIAAVGVIAVTLASGAGMLRWLGLSPGRAAHAGALRPWLVPALVLAALAVALVWWGPRLERGKRMRALAWFVSADIALFALLSVVSVAPGAGRTAASGIALMTRSPTVPLGRLTAGGRFAIYDPGLIASDELPALGVPDSNVMSGTPSIEGYSSIVDAAYAAATGSHRASGQGQDVLAPRAIGNGTLDQLNTTVLLTPAAYLITPASGPSARTSGASAGAGGSSAPGGGGPGYRNLAPHQSATWNLAALLPVTSITIPLASPAVTSAVRVGLVQPPGSVDWIAAAPGPGGQLYASLATPQEAVAVRVIAGPGSAALGPPVIGTAGGTRYRAAGPLQNALVPPRWRLRGFDGDFAVFSDVLARPALTLQALPHESTAGATVRATAGPRFAPASAQVSSAHGVTIIRAVADIAGWTATWRPAGTHAVDNLPVRRSGLVQAVTVPAGRGTVTWLYNPPGARLGLWVSLAALAVLMGASVTAASSRRPRTAAAGGSGDTCLPASR